MRRGYAPCLYRQRGTDVSMPGMQGNKNCAKGRRQGGGGEVKETCVSCGFTVDDDDYCAWYPGTGLVCQDCLENPVEEEGTMCRPKSDDELFGFELLMKRGYD
jgi:hypothetical protein